MVGARTANTKSALSSDLPHFLLKTKTNNMMPQSIHKTQKMIPLQNDQASPNGTCLGARLAQQQAKAVHQPAEMGGGAPTAQT